MGCDIHAYVEVRSDDCWDLAMGPGVVEFERDYRLFGWLAGVRNYGGVTPLSEPRGTPPGISRDVDALLESWGGDAHSTSYFTLEELLAVDYEALAEDRRCKRMVAPGFYSGVGCTCEPGEGETMTLREFLGPHYFKQLEKMKALDAPSSDVRLVFWFDN